MKKIVNQANKGWQSNFEDNGFDYHSLDGKYWIDNYHIELEEKEANALIEAANEVHSMCLELVAENVRTGNFEKYNLPHYVIPAIEESWKRKDFHLYGRFDFAFDGTGSPKMLEYNADTPTSVVETAVGQSIWQAMQKEQFGQEMIMFNNLANAMRARLALWKQSNPGKNFYFSGSELTIEDWGNVVLMSQWAKDVGIVSEAIDFGELRYNEDLAIFADKDDNKIDALFKLYPWEFIFEEKNFVDYEVTSTHIIEPMWKALLSTKAILPMLWDMFKGHKNLLPAFFTQEEMLNVSNSYVKKPIYSREGANIVVIENDKLLDSANGIYGKEGYVYQQKTNMAKMDDAFYVFGTWIIGDKMEGLAIREDKTIITKNTSFFVPHNIK